MCPKYRKIVFLNSQLATLAKLLITIQPADTVSLMLALSLATIRLLSVLYIPATNTHRLLGNSFAISVSCTAGAILIFDRWVATSGSVHAKEYRGIYFRICSRKMHFQLLLPNLCSWKEEAK